VPQLEDREVRGRLSGDLTLTDLHKDARASAALEVEHLSMGRTRFKKARVDAGFDGHTLDVHARLEQKDGFADVVSKLAMTWGKDLTPSPDPKGPLTAQLTAKHLAASFLEPLFPKTLDELDGLIDADARLALAPGKKPEMAGTVLFHDGRLDLAATGQELHGVNAKLSLREDGSIALEDVVAYGSTGKITGSGGAHIDGMALSSMNVRLDVAKKDALPFAVGGSNMGTAFGRVELKAGTSQDRSATSIELDVRYDDDEVVADVVLQRAFEGAPGRAHGGIVAAAFDDVTGFVIGMLQEPAFTGELTVRYLAPVPVDEHLEIRARLD
jgi:hypothetical protein